jgi:5-methyltetrahydropteroyltriglutamate--homocysteine methyltransferase
VPDDRIIVLGLVTTKRSDLEREDELEARVREAARHTGLERLAVGTQCGFATSVGGNAITPEAQREKLRLIVRLARRVLGD